MAKMKNKCVLIKSNALDRDIRIPKEIASLEKYYDVLFIGWNREKSCDKKILQTEKYNQKLFNLKSPYGKIILFYLPIWWFFISFHLFLTKWDIAHVINFDSAVPVILISKIKNKKVIYEILDTYEDSMILPLHLRNILIQVDKFFLSISDFVILADDAQKEEFQGIPNKNVVTIYDSPPDTYINTIKQEKSHFYLFYAGVLYKARNLNIDKIITAVKEIDGVKVIFAGYGDLVPEIQNAEKEKPEKIQYIGKIPYNRVMSLIQEFDLLIVLRDPSVLINKYICGSTILNSMMCGKPIIVNRNTSTASKVMEENCGLVVDSNNIDQIKMAIVLLRDNNILYHEMAKNARNAYEEKYSWRIMEDKLLCIYEKALYGD